MESILSLVVKEENVRILVMLVFGFSCFVWLRTSLGKKIDGVEASLNKQIDELRHNDLVAIHKRIDNVDVSLNKRIDGVELSIKDLKYNDLTAIHKRIDGVEASIKELKYNDFAHLNNTIEALTYALEKNGSLERGDKEYVDKRLAH